MAKQLVDPTILEDKNRIYVLSEVCNPFSKIHDNVEENGTGVIGAYNTFSEIIEAVTLWKNNISKKGFEIVKNTDNDWIKFQCNDEHFYLKLDLMKCNSNPLTY